MFSSVMFMLLQGNNAGKIRIPYQPEKLFWTKRQETPETSRPLCYFFQLSSPVSTVLLLLFSYRVLINRTRNVIMFIVFGAVIYNSVF